MMVCAGMPLANELAKHMSRSFKMHVSVCVCAHRYASFREKDNMAATQYARRNGKNTYGMLTNVSVNEYV